MKKIKVIWRETVVREQEFEFPDAIADALIDGDGWEEHLPTENLDPDKSCEIDSDNEITVVEAA